MGVWSTQGAALAACAGLMMGTLSEAQALRPTAPEHPLSYGAVEADYLDSPAGYVRVWWAAEGPHASPRLAPGGEEPEIARMVAEVGDAMFASVEDYGLRLPLSDAEIYPAGADDGGDGRFDIYLYNFEAGDGQYVAEYCLNGAVERCAGYAMLDHAFVPLYYPSRELAVKIVVSHELFHAVQAAYRADWPVWASEGSASWFEEVVYPEQDDFERLAGYYFAEPARSLNDRARGPSDGFAYGAGIFFYYLETILGQQSVAAVAERFAQGGSFEEALLAELDASFGDAEAAVELFAIYNLFTGQRALADEGYADAARFDEVEVVSLPGGAPFNWEQNVDAFSARFARWEVEQPMTVTLAEVEGWPSARLAVLRGGQGPSAGYESLEVGQSLAVGPADAPVYLVASQGIGEDAVISVRGRLPVEAPDEEDAPEEVATGGCAQAGKGAPGGWVWSVLIASLMVRGRRRRRA
ncbi:hypothetical protein DL240_04595 [Lujinxingia litoralis]|uniref:Peptidase MA-like domain-containing protein n=1 Tax=Lujinxingia litoralis TaxID=2211119 RepID=A0A328CAJ2_9DELT|nr:MXAN_6640 family putative metalloprotease [Lujinxingia litoralis]RAL25495.1 hypothetical protein DL240_04595 [Lujinxingia litoralis]